MLIFLFFLQSSMEKAKAYIKNELRGGSFAQSQEPPPPSASSQLQQHHHQQLHLQQQQQHQLQLQQHHQQQQHQHHQQQQQLQQQLQQHQLQQQHQQMQQLHHNQQIHYHHQQEDALSICYVCGIRAQFEPYHIRSKPNPERPNEPYFPFLENHEPPNGLQNQYGSPIVRSCYMCYVLLTQQWENFEREGKPYNQRVYSFKRVDGKSFIGAEMSSQGEYAAQMLGLTAEHLPTSGSTNVRPSSQNDSPLNKDNSIYQKRDIQLSNNNNQARPLSRSEKVTTPNSQSRPVSRENTLTPNQIRQHNSSYDGLPLKPSPFAQHKLKLGSINYLNCLSPSNNNDTTPKSLNTHGTDEALDLRNTSSRSSDTPKSNNTAVSSLSVPGSVSAVPSATDILDLSMPDKNAITEVCYVCGDEYRRGSLMELSTVEPKVNREHSDDSQRPYFPIFNESHPRPARSRPKDPKGMIQACKPCFQYLLQQWHNFQVRSII